MARCPDPVTLLAGPQPNAMIGVPMESDMKAPSAWNGKVGTMLACQLYPASFATANDAEFESNIDSLYKEICKVAVQQMQRK